MLVCWNRAWNIVNAQDLFYICILRQHVVYFFLMLTFRVLFKWSVSCVSLFYAFFLLTTSYLRFLSMSLNVTLSHSLLLWHSIPWSANFNVFTKRFRLLLILCYLNSCECVSELYVRNGIAGSLNMTWNFQMVC